MQCTLKGLLCSGIFPTLAVIAIPCIKNSLLFSVRNRPGLMEWGLDAMGFSCGHDHAFRD